MKAQRLADICERELLRQLQWDSVRKQFSGGIADLLRDSKSSGRRVQRDIYDEAMRYVRNGSWREIAQASMAGKLAGVPVFKFVSALKSAGVDEDRIVGNLNYDGRGGYSIVDVEDALQRLNWNRDNPTDQVPTRPGKR